MAKSEHRKRRKGRGPGGEASYRLALERNRTPPSLTQEGHRDKWTDRGEEEGPCVFIFTLTSEVRTSESEGRSPVGNLNRG